MTVEARHVVEALAQVLKSVRTPVDFPILYVWSDAEDLARVALAFASELVPKERAPTRESSAEECHGWNTCRAEMLRRLGREEGV